MKSSQPVEPAILLVDDERQTLKYFERAFARDFPVLTAASADEAEAIVDANVGKIGVVITDQRMPERTGVSLLKSIRKKHPAIVRMLTTAYSQLDDAIDAVNRGEIFRYIVKPWDFDLLRQEIRTALMVYNLQLERQLLIGEKLNVRHRMVAVDRVRDLAVIAAGLPRLRFAQLAVDDYVRDSVGTATAAEAMTPSELLDLWSIPKSEAVHMGAVARSAAATAERLSGAKQGDASLGDCVTQAVAATAAQARSARVTVAADGVGGLSVAVAPDVLSGLLTDTLSAMIREMVEGGQIDVTAKNGATVNAAPGALVMLNARGDVAGSDPLLYGMANLAEEPGRLFAAYLATRESGGTIKVARNAEGMQAEIALPLDRTKISVTEAKPDWLVTLFQRFENWPT